jgi:outer membrane lipoprotein-sorting protein
MKKLILVCLLLIQSLFAITNEELAKQSDATTDGFVSSSSNMTMTLINAHNQKTIRDMKSITLEGRNGDKSLMEFLSPADVKGTKMLTHEYINKDDNQWMYLPALKRIKRIASRNKSGSFMGSEFSYEDTGNAKWEEFTYVDGLEEVTIDGVVCLKGVRVPKDKYSGYTKQITWIEKERKLVKRVDYYDRKKELLKTAIFSKWKKIDGVYVMGQIHMTNHQNGKQTILEWSDQKIKVGLRKKDFSKRVLKR